MEQFKDRLRMLRDSTGANQIELAEKLGIKGSTYSSYENGVIPKTDTIALIAKYFNVTMDYLVGNTNEKRPAGTALSKALSVLADEAGDVIPSGENFIKLFNELTYYYQHGAPCGDIPSTALNGFVCNMIEVINAVNKNDTAKVLDAANATITSALSISYIPNEFIKKQRTEVQNGAQ